MAHTALRSSTRRTTLALLAILVAAALLRGWLIAGEGFSFDSDEAVVGLMARHILQGNPIPTFYYGQAYMGSLDALLVAGGFALLGESVTAIRVVQLALYLAGLVTAYGLARAVTSSRRVALVTLLLLAFPTALGTLYTGITLGGYNEIVILGNLVLWLGWSLAVARRAAWWRWALLGLAVGVGWWINGAIITSALVTVFFLLRTFNRRQWRGYALAGLAFLIGSAPWWSYNLRHDWEALQFLSSGFTPLPGVEPVSLPEALAGLVLLGLPALYGLRLPWEAGPVTSAAAGVLAVILLLLAADMIAGWGFGTANPTDRYRRARRWVWAVFGTFALVFVASSFSDATGRYLLPLWVPGAIGLALGLERLRRGGVWVHAVLLVGLLAAQTGLVVRAAHTGTGLTPQLVERLRVPPVHDTALLDFVADAGYTHGYAAYWTSYRLIFRSHETLILDTALPYDAQGYREVTNRYPPYRAEVDAAPRVIWITQNFPDLDAAIAVRLNEAGITYQIRDFGPYRLYYDFSRRVAPADLGLDRYPPRPRMGAP